METIRKSWNITSSLVDQLIKYIFSLLLVIATMLFTLAFLGCSKEHVPPLEQDTSTQLRVKIQESKSRTVPVIIKGKYFGESAEGINVFVDEKEVEVLRVKDTEITVSLPMDYIKYKREGKVEIYRYGKFVKAFDLLDILDLTWVSTVAGSSYGFEDGPALTAKFKSPTGIAIDNSGTIYVADYGNYKIRKMDPDGTVSTLAGDGTWGYQDGPGATAKFPPLGHIAVDGNGNVYVAHYHMIRKISPNGYVSTIAGSTSSGYADGPGTMARFDFLSGIDVDAQGNLYVADVNNNKIRKVTLGTFTLPSGATITTSYVTTIAGSTEGFADGPAASAKFKDPAGVALDNQGNIYVADWLNSAIRKIDPYGNVTTLATSVGFTSGIAVDDVTGNIYWSLWQSDIIKKLSPNGTVSTLAGSTMGFADGYWAIAKFYSPNDVAVGPNGNVFVADRYNHKIRKITLDN